MIDPDFRLQAEMIECLLPLAPGPVPAGHGNAVPCVAHTVHEREGRGREEPLANVVLDEEDAAGDTNRFREKTERILGVMQNVNEQNGLEASVGGGDREAVETVDGDRRARPNGDVEAADFQVGAPLEKRFRKRAVSRPQIQHACLRGNQGRQMAGQNAHAAREDAAPVKALEEAHRRFKPRMLKKKLERMV